MNEGNSQSITFNTKDLTLVNSILFIATVLILGYVLGQTSITRDRTDQATEMARDVRDRQADDSVRMREQEELFKAWTANVGGKFENVYGRVRELEKSD